MAQKMIIFQFRSCIAAIGPWYYGPDVCNPLTAPNGPFPVGPFSTKTEARKFAKVEGHEVHPVPCFFSLDAIIHSPANTRWLTTQKGWMK